MSREASPFEELADNIRNRYLENSPFCDFVRRQDFTDRFKGIEYYQAGQWVSMANDFLPELTADRFTKKLWNEERRFVVEQVKMAANDDEIPVKRATDYTDISKIIERMRGATHAIFPTKTGRPKLVHDEMQKVKGAQFGLSSVETKFFDSDMFDPERAIIIDSDYSFAVQKRVNDLDTPDQFTSSQLTHLAQDGDYVDMYEVENSHENEFYYRTVFSGLQNISEDHVAVVELPD